MPTGLVLKSTGTLYVVLSTDGQKWECQIRGKLRIAGMESTNPIAVGDNVEFDVEKPGQGNITNILPRKNYIIRKSVNLSKRSQIIATNIDRVYLLATISNPTVQTGFIDRFLVTAEAYHIPATLVFNKCDLYGADELSRLAQLKVVYRSAGYPTMEISALDPETVDPLRQEIKGCTVLLSGQSGVGKSTLANALDRNLHLRTGEISGHHTKGQHTTTFAEMFLLRTGGFVIDTPGIKSFGLFDFDKRELSHCFPEMRNVLQNCKFHNCQHVEEPGCAVKLGLDKGTIYSERYLSYLAILNSDEDESYRRDAHRPK